MDVEWDGGRELEDVRLATTRLVRGINVLGLPAVSIPLPCKQLPIGLQIIGQPFSRGARAGSGRRHRLSGLYFSPPIITVHPNFSLATAPW